ncbi:uncharacterized protein DNG_08537 [Cephalotrichum gorgonifer]|uniref:Uncharacterized protein n=1 Tax=Cephalotrichum gorgonifer TaxID=2041049 RepID=A0AAE8SYG1_9PEZI|nr:uncharacterized protein DNG_08537 [Cephalotrichum gorgonifer]
MSGYSTPLSSPSLSLPSSSSLSGINPYWQAAAAAAASVPGLRAIRPSPPSIPGSAVEREYFDEFRRTVETGLSQHVSNSDDFWRWTVPHLCLSAPAVRNAVLALSAAFRTYQLAELPHGSSSAPSETEVFMLDQYGRAMTMLGRADGDAPGTTAITLVCCLIFVYIEMLRDNWPQAICHLEAGLAIIDSAIPLERLLALASPKASAMLEGDHLTSEIDHVVHMFTSLEISASLYTDRIKPVIALKLYEARELAEVRIPEFTDVGEAHRMTTQYFRDVIAAKWIGNAGGSPSGSSAARQRQGLALANMGVQLDYRLRQFSESTHAPKPWSLAGISLRIDLMHFTCARQIGRGGRRTVSLGLDIEDEYDDFGAWEEVVLVIESVQSGISMLASAAHRGRWFMLDMGIVSMVHYVVQNCRDGRTRERALRVLRGWERRENFWDGPEVRMLLEAGKRERWDWEWDWDWETGMEMPKGPDGGSVVPVLKDMMKALSISPPDDDGGKEDEPGGRWKGNGGGRETGKEKGWEGRYEYE